MSLAIHGVAFLPPAHPRPSLRRVPMCTPGHHCPRPSRNYGRRDRGVAAVPSGPGNLDRRLRCGGRRDERRVAPRQGGKPWPLIGGSPAAAAWSRPTNKSLGKALGKNGSSCRLLKRWATLKTAPRLRERRRRSRSAPREPRSTRSVAADEKGPVVAGASQDVRLLESTWLRRCRSACSRRMQKGPAVAGARGTYVRRSVRAWLQVRPVVAGASRHVRTRVAQATRVLSHLL